MKLPTETENLFSALRQSAKPKPVSAIEKLIEDEPDRELCRINALAFAVRHGLDEDDVIGAFLHGARLGLFDMSWNILCPACGGILDSGATLKTVRQAEYRCVLCARGREPTLDEKVVLSLQLPEGEVDMFDPVLHMSQHLEVKGEPAGESQSLSFVMTRDHV